MCTRNHQVDNVAVQLTLDRQYTGLGEVGILHPVTRETFESALADCTHVSAVLPSLHPDLEFDLTAKDSKLRRFEELLKEHLPHSPACRAAFEMAAVDALARAAGTPLFELFGGSTDRIETDITIPISSHEDAHRLAMQYHQRGFKVIKTKVGKNWRADLDRLKSIRAGHPTCDLTVDGNEGFSTQVGSGHMNR